MSFINERYAIIRRSDKSMFYIYISNDGLYYNYYNSDNTIVSTNKLLEDNNLDFTKYNFSIDQYDNIHCIYCNKSLQVLECKNNSHIFTQKEFITYNYKKFGLTFPYIKYIKKKHPHIFYYVFNNSSTDTYALFHHYKHNNYWIENKIDFINSVLLNDFTVLWNEKVPTVFYFKLINGCEEIFSSRFNLGTFSWCEPVQITNTGKSKLYLNCIKDNINFYHLSFCEYNHNGYEVKYINGFLNENKFNLNTYSTLSKPSTCMYPSILKINSELLISWVKLNKLFICKSEDLGKTWSEPVVDELSSEDDFIRSIFNSNYKNDLEYNVNQVFSTVNNIGILGI